MRRSGWTAGIVVLLWAAGALAQPPQDTAPAETPDTTEEPPADGAEVPPTEGVTDDAGEADGGQEPPGGAGAATPPFEPVVPVPEAVPTASEAPPPPAVNGAPATAPTPTVPASAADHAGAPAASASSSGARPASTSPRVPTQDLAPETGESRSAEGDDSDDEGTDFLWLDVNLGYSYVNGAQFKYDNLLPEVSMLEGTGPMFGVGAGLRLLILTVGARASLASYSDIDVGTAVLDLGLRIPTGSIEPYLRLGAGYGWLGSTPDDTSVYGFAGEFGMGLDIRLGSLFAIGGGFDLVFLNLNRQSVEDCVTGGECRIGELDLNAEGSAAGLQLRGHLNIGLRI